MTVPKANTTPPREPRRSFLLPILSTSQSPMKVHKKLTDATAALSLKQHKYLHFTSFSVADTDNQGVD